MNLFTVAMVAATILIAANGPQNGYVYNVEKENEAITAQTVYKIDSSGK